MTLTTIADTALERILAIKWEPDDTRVDSHIPLLREYLRRAALWAKALDCTDEWPFFDVAAHLCPLDTADQTKIEALNTHFTQIQFYATGIIEKTCKWFIHWECVKNLPKVSEFTLPEPYEPLIIMYERGGIFSTEHGFFDFGVASFPRGQWKQYDQTIPLLELDAKTLDEIDIYADDDSKLGQLIVVNNLKQGVEHWNKWRDYHYVAEPDFSGEDFSGKDLSDANLNGAIFDNANLSNTNFQGADLHSATFNNANLDEANFTEADITRAVLSGAINRNTANFTNVINRKETQDRASTFSTPKLGG